MTKKKRAIQIATIILIILTLNFLKIINLTYASSNNENAKNINSAYIYQTGDCGQLLRYKGITVKVSYVEYQNNGVCYPAYCMDKTKPGAETEPYEVSVKELIKDLELWKIIINGYPYKSFEQLGVANKEEAFTATKQAIYCYIHKNNPNDYTAIGKAGERTLNALKGILESAKNSNETQISNTININRNTLKWEQDKIDKEYVSKTYSVESKGNINEYQIYLKNENGIDLGGIKLTDENNVEKSEFKKGESFKILVPIKNMTDKGNIKIEVKAKVETKPILYGKAPNSSMQDYALTAETYEDGEGYINEEYQKNETKIILIKQDAETKERLENIEFQLLDENKKVVYSNLKTNKEGKIVIENLVPNKYYIKEINSIDGYEIYDELIEVDIALNEELTVTINNNKEEKPVFEKIEKEKSVRKLPITGM